jgi:hypothetical protein
MALLWPTCLSNFFYAFSLVNFESSVLTKVVSFSSSSYPEINSFFTGEGYETRLFLLNTFDIIFISCCLLALIPAFFTLNRFVKVEFIQRIAKRYYTHIGHELLLVVYLQITLAALLWFGGF